jgi:peptidyl-prolyl cis-trans isomerase SurA
MSFVSRSLVWCAMCKVLAVSLFHRLGPLVVALALVLTAGLAAQAQEVQSIAAIVNDEPVSDYDLDQRLRLALATSGRQLSSQEEFDRLRKRVLQELVDERLQLQEAKANEVEVSEEDLAKALESIAAQNNLTLDQMKAMLGSAGVDIKTLEDQVHAQLAWRALVRRRFLPRIGVGDEDVDAAYAQIKANAALPERLVAEIFLAVESPEQEPEVRRTAQEIVERLRNGAPFPVVAREYSEAATAAVGGDLGWVLRGQLAEEVDDVLDVMQEGEVSSPIRTANGYTIVALRDRRAPLSERPRPARLSLYQLILPLPKDAPAEQAAATMARAQALKARVNDCGALAATPEAKESPLSGPLGTVAAADLPDEMREPLLYLDAGAAAAPFRTESGVHLVMVCKREEVTSQMPTRNMVESRLQSERLEGMARRYLRDLRRDAVVEYR